IKPFLGNNPANCELLKTSEKASPGFYEVGFANKIKASLAVLGKAGKHAYQFPKGEKGFYLDLSYAFNSAFVDEEHQINGHAVSGWVVSKTTCGVGKYKLFYHLELKKNLTWKDEGNHKLVVKLNDADTGEEIDVAFSSVSVEAAKASINKASFQQLKAQSSLDWNMELSKIAVAGDMDNAKLFYSLLYRTMQSPYIISETDGQYRNTRGELSKDEDVRYNGWAIWDNYRTQLPLLSLIVPERYQGITNSIADLYNSGKKDYATQTEPSNTVRTEHGIVVLLDAYRKGYKVDFNKIIWPECAKITYKALLLSSSIKHIAAIFLVLLYLQRIMLRYFLLFFLFTFQAYGQEHIEITGSINDIKGSAIPFASIYVKGTNISS
ncbi:MAG: alpha-mannosidase, partial [Pedobacter sp.]